MEDLYRNGLAIQFCRMGPDTFGHDWTMPDGFHVPSPAVGTDVPPADGIPHDEQDVQLFVGCVSSAGPQRCAVDRQ